MRCGGMPSFQLLYFAESMLEQAPEVEARDVLEAVREAAGRPAHPAGRDLVRKSEGGGDWKLADRAAHGAPPQTARRGRVTGALRLTD